MLSGVFGLLVPGGAFVLQLIQSLLQALLLGCCLLAMRRERVSRERRSRFFHCRRHAAIYKPRAAAPNGPRRVGRCA
jgi:hypothetical protein